MGNNVENFWNNDKTDAAFLNRRVFSLPDHLRKSCSDDDVYDIRNKIRTAFHRVTSHPLKGIIFQFWAPVKTTTGRPLLTCKDYPYAHVYANPKHRRYRSISVNSQYSIDDVNTVGFEEKKDPNTTIISGGLPARAFLNHFPEVVLDLRAHQGMRDALVDSALECEFTCSIMLPVFDQSSSSCVGVVECSMKVFGMVVIFNELKSALKHVGLSIYHLQGSWPYKAVSVGLKAATNEIENALNVVCESHDLTLGQVWIPYESESPYHHVPCSSSSMEEMKRMFLIKLTGYGICSTEDPLSSSIIDFYDNCDVLPLKIGEGLAGKTLETSQPHFCRNIYKLNSDNEGGLLAILSVNTKCSRFVICLRSTYTEGDDIDYVFEFFWLRNRDCGVVLECLLLNLKKWLPSFKFASGAQLGDELCVVDVTRSGIGSFKILQGNKLSQTSDVMKETRTLVPGVKKRKLSDLNQPNQEHLTNIYRKTDDDDDVDDDDDEVIVVYHPRGRALILLPKRSSTLKIAMKKICKELDLDPARDYQLKFEVNDGEWADIKIGNENSFKGGLEYRRKIGKPYFKLHVWWW